MDLIDQKIIKYLKGNSRITSSEISRNVMLSVPAVSERIRKLEEEKIISQFTIKLNRKKFNLNLLAFVFVTIDKAENMKTFREMVMQNEWILECHHLAGEDGYLLKVLVEDTEHLEIFISHVLKKTLGVSKVQTQIVLSTLKEEV